MTHFRKLAPLQPVGLHEPAPRAADLAAFMHALEPGWFGWDCAFSTSLYVDPREEMIGILMAQCRPGALRLPPVIRDFWTSAYQAIDD